MYEYEVLVYVQDGCVGGVSELMMNWSVRVDVRAFLSACPLRGEVNCVKVAAGNRERGHMFFKCCTCMINVIRDRVTALAMF